MRPANTASKSLSDKIAIFLNEAKSCTEAEAMSKLDEYFPDGGPARDAALSSWKRMRARLGEERDEGIAEELANALPDYHLLEKVGSGGFGLVYRGIQLGLNRPVAVKVLRGKLNLPPLLLDLEARRMCAISHESVCRVYDAGETESGRPYFVMEYVEGAPIDEQVFRKGLPLEDRIHLISRVARAVGELHNQGIIHRDLKPSNVLLNEEGNPKVIDFGASRFLRTTPEDLLVSSALGNQVPHNASYSPPEQRTDEGDATVDTYALGRILLKLITGELGETRDPITPSTYAIPDAHAQKMGFTDGTAVGRKCQGDLDAIVLKATAVEPARRYKTSSALAEDLERYLTKRPVSAVANTAAYRGRLFLRRNPLWVGLTALIVFALIGTAIFALGEGVRARSAERRAQESLNEALRGQQEALAGRTEALAQAEEAKREARNHRDAIVALKTFAKGAAQGMGAAGGNRIRQEAELWVAMARQAKQQRWTDQVQASIVFNAHEKAVESNHPEAACLQSRLQGLTQATGGNFNRSLRARPGLWSLLEQISAAMLEMRVSPGPPKNLETIRALARANIPHLRDDNRAWESLRAVCGKDPEQIQLKGLVPELKEICR